MTYKIKYLIIFLYIPIIFYSCSATKQGRALIRTPEKFISLNDYVYVENSNDSAFARLINNAVHVLIDSVELKHYCRFIDPPKVYLCSTLEAFCKCTGSKHPGPRAFTSPKGIFISPRLKGSSDWFDIVYHELSHGIMFQHLGIYRYRKIPVWFQEGLATFISNGGGSGNITDSAAIFELLHGSRFNPVARESIFIPKSFKNTSAEAWMLYRQSMLFVAFLVKGKEQAFEELMRQVIKKEFFSKAIKNAYKVKLTVLWDAFIKEIGNPEKKQEYQLLLQHRKPICGFAAPLNPGETV